MKKAIIYVFSGTGNTRIVADLYKKYLSDFETEIYDIRMKCKEEGRKKKFEFEKIPNPNDFDVVAFAYPVHGFNSPKVVFDFCRQLPVITNCRMGSRKKTFIFKTSGEGLSLNNYSSQKIIRLLEKKGFEFHSERHYVMPYNMIFRHKPEMVKAEYIYADAQVRLHVQQLAKGKKEKVKYNPLRYWFVPIVRILWIYARVQGPTMFASDKKCTKCMKCVKACPMNNISVVDGKIKFGSNCVLCVACSFGCPTKAISIGLLNGWRINGSYKVLQTAADPELSSDYFGENLKGFHRFLYYRYYRRLDQELAKGGVSLNVE